MKSQPLLFLRSALSAVLLVFSAATAQAAIFGSEVVAHWEFDDTTDSSSQATRPLSLLDGATLSGGGLQLDPDPSNNRAVTAAFNPNSGFSVYVDFQADTVPTGSVDPQYILLSNIGNDTIRTFDQFSLSAGYMVALRPNRVDTFQKTGGSFNGAVGAALALPDPTGRHRVTVNWEYDDVLDLFRSQIFLDGNAASAPSAWGPMDFGMGLITSDLILGTNVDEAFQPPRTFDGTIYEAAIFQRSLSQFETYQLGAFGLAQTLIPEPGAILLLACGLPAAGLRRV